MSRLDSIDVARVSQADLLDGRVAKYIVTVIMAPLPDDQQKPEVASAVLAKLGSGNAEAHWILSSDGRRCGVIVYTVGPYSERDKDIKVLYVVGFNFPSNAPEAAWDTLIAKGRGVAAAHGCKYIMYDVAPDGPHTERLIDASLRARAQVRFTMEA